MFYSFAGPTSAKQKDAFENQRPNTILTIHLKDDLGLGDIQEALGNLVNKYELLRTSFSPQGDFYFINSKIHWEMDMQKISSQQEMDEFLNEESHKEFDLSQEPCFRAYLINHKRLAVVFPRIISEHDSFSFIPGELHKLERPHDLKEKIRILWMNVMKLEDVAFDDNFFKLGGHSLLAVELAEKLKNEFDKDVYVRDIFEYPTINDLHARLQELGVAKTEYLITTTHDTVGPVSFNQMQVWYVEELFPGTKMHNLSTSLRMKWKVRPDLLEKTVHYMFQRHEALRTIFILQDDLPVQKVLSKHDPVFRPKLITVETKEDQVLTMMKAETSQNFNIYEAPLFRAKLFKLSEDDFVFFFMVHHGVWDGWCFDIFFEELNRIYTAFEKGEVPVFNKNPEMSYLDFSKWQRDSLEAGIFSPQINFWKQKLKTPLPVLELPLDFPRPKSPTHDGGNFRFSLSDKQIFNLKMFAATRNASVFNVLLTAFKMTLAHKTNLTDIIVGSPNRGRNLSSLQQTIGYFVNTIALRSHINLNLSFEHNLKVVTKSCLDAFDNQDVPFEIILQEVEYPRDLSRTAIFQTYFTFQDMTNRQFSINGREVKQMSVNNASVKTDFDMWIKVTTYSIEGAFEYRSDLFKESTVKEFYNVFLGIVDQLSERSGQHQIYFPRYEKPEVNPVVHRDTVPGHEGWFGKLIYWFRKAFYRYFELPIP